MGAFENFEAVKPTEAAKESSFGQLSWESNTAGQFADNQSKTESLEDKGILPDMGLFQDAITAANHLDKKQLQDAGIKSHTDIEDGAKTVKAEYPNGVRVTTSGEHKVHTDSGRDVTITNGSMIEIQPPNKIKPNGEVVDANGRTIAKQNDDGSVTVDTGKGFYTQDSDGIRKVTALRSRDGKSFEVIDTETPLGDLKPNDLSKQKH